MKQFLKVIIKQNIYIIQCNTELGKMLNDKAWNIPNKSEEDLLHLETSSNEH